MSLHFEAKNLSSNEEGEGGHYEQREVCRMMWFMKPDGTWEEREVCQIMWVWFPNK